jgi:hypothetical protein
MFGRRGRKAVIFKSQVVGGGCPVNLVDAHSLATPPRSLEGGQKKDKSPLIQLLPPGPPTKKLVDTLIGFRVRRLESTYYCPVLQ